jgi:hypothetical protein
MLHLQTPAFGSVAPNIGDVNRYTSQGRKTDRETQDLATAFEGCAIDMDGRRGVTLGSKGRGHCGVVSVFEEAPSTFEDTVGRVWNQEIWIWM